MPPLVLERFEDNTTILDTRGGGSVEASRRRSNSYFVWDQRGLYDAGQSRCKWYSLSLYSQGAFSNPGDTFFASPRFGSNVIRVLVRVAFLLNVVTRNVKKSTAENKFRVRVSST